MARLLLSLSLSRFSAFFLANEICPFTRIECATQGSVRSAGNEQEPMELKLQLKLERGFRLMPVGTALAAPAPAPPCPTLALVPVLIRIVLSFPEPALVSTLANGRETPQVPRGT